MQAASRQVSSSQVTVHPRLAEIVGRHLAGRHRPVIARHNRLACATLRAALEASGRPLVLDSFCGTGHSTRALAHRHPGHFVVGIDKSAHRLAKHPARTCANYLLLRADCEAVWELLARDGLRAAHHYLLYPNPWPKPGQLKRRVHGHPAFPALLGLGGTLELRSNWRLYVEEFARAVHIAGHHARVCPVDANAEPLTLFERKYRASGHALWACGADLGSLDNSG